MIPTSPTMNKRAIIAAVALLIAASSTTATAHATSHAGTHAAVAEIISENAPVEEVEGPVHILAGPATKLDTLGTAIINGSAAHAQGPLGVITTVFSLPMWIILTLAFTIQSFFTQGCN